MPVCVRTYKGKRQSKIGNVQSTMSVLQSTFDRILGESSYHRSKVFESSSDRGEDMNSGRINLTGSKEISNEDQCVKPEPKFFGKNKSQVLAVQPIEGFSLWSDSSSGMEIRCKRKCKKRDPIRKKKKKFKKRKESIIKEKFDDCLNAFISRNIHKRYLPSSTPKKVFQSLKIERNLFSVTFSPIKNLVTLKEGTPELKSLSVSDHNGLSMKTNESIKIISFKSDKLESTSPPFQNITNSETNQERFSRSFEDQSDFNGFNTNNISQENNMIILPTSNKLPSISYSYPNLIRSASVVHSSISVIDRDEVSKFYGFESFEIKKIENSTKKMYKGETNSTTLLQSSVPLMKMKSNLPFNHETVYIGNQSLNSFPRKSKKISYFLPLLRIKKTKASNISNNQDGSLSVCSNKIEQSKDQSLFEISKSCGEHEKSKYGKNMSHQKSDHFDYVDDLREHSFPVQDVANIPDIHAVNKVSSRQTFTIRNFPVYRPFGHMSIEPDIEESSEFQKQEYVVNVSAYDPNISIENESLNYECEEDEKSLDMFEDEECGITVHDDSQDSQENICVNSKSLKDDLLVDTSTQGSEKSKEVLLGNIHELKETGPAIIMTRSRRRAFHDKLDEDMSGLSLKQKESNIKLCDYNLHAEIEDLKDLSLNKKMGATFNSVCEGNSSFTRSSKLTNENYDLEFSMASVIRGEENDELFNLEELIVIPAGKRYRRSLSILRGSISEDLNPQLGPKGRLYENSVSQILQLQRQSSRFSLLSTVSHINETDFRCSKLSTTPSRRKMLAESFSKSIPESSIIAEVGDEESHKHFILRVCEQTEACDFETIAPLEGFDNCHKIGEGVYGEVFTMFKESRNIVLKIIPIEGDFPVNGEPQKKFDEVYSELSVAHFLHGLSDERCDYHTVGFSELIKAWLIKGKYPEKLVELWNEFNEKKGSDNDSPIIFKEDQLYLVLELGHAGTDLESYTFSTAKQSLSVFMQVAASLAVAEGCYEFEHRDLHWGNILISKTSQKVITFTLDGENYDIKTAGVKGTVIDFTLSRMTIGGHSIYNDIGKDPEMFIATGDYQFDIYRHMKSDVKNEWDSFAPKTNVRWLHYLVDKLIKRAKYFRPKAKVHVDSMRVLTKIESWLLECNNSVEVALRLMNNN